jgi:hypothetical protein
MGAYSSPRAHWFSRRSPAVSTRSVLRKAKFLGVPDSILYVRVKPELRACSSARVNITVGFGSKRRSLSMQHALVMSAVPVRKASLTIARLHVFWAECLLCVMRIRAVLVIGQSFDTPSALAQQLRLGMSVVDLGMLCLIPTLV